MCIFCLKKFKNSVILYIDTIGGDVVSQLNFKRLEQKYLLNKQQFLALEEMLNEKFIPGDYFNSEVYNLYFDNINHDIIINSIEKPDFKDKIRLRGYENLESGSSVYLESKKKYRGVVYKRRVVMTLMEWKSYYEHGIFPNHDLQIMKEIDYEIKLFKLKPMYFVSYKRKSWRSIEDENFRVTIDSDLKGRMIFLDLVSSEHDRRYFYDDTCIMEVKCTNSLPLWFVKILNENKIYPSSFSKVGNIYMKERGGKIC